MDKYFTQLPWVIQNWMVLMEEDIVTGNLVPRGSYLEGDIWLYILGILTL